MRAADRARARLRRRRRRVLRRPLLPGVRRADRAAAGRPAAGRGHRHRRPQARPPRLRAVEGAQGRRARRPPPGPTPWGRGRPGWHLECSAMAAQLPRRGVRHPRRRAGPALPAPRERAGAVPRGRRRLRPVLAAQRLGHPGRREDEQVAGQHRPGRRGRAAGAAGRAALLPGRPALPVDDRVHRRRAGRGRRRPTGGWSPSCGGPPSGSAPTPGAGACATTSPTRWTTTWAPRRRSRRSTSMVREGNTALADGDDARGRRRARRRCGRCSASSGWTRWTRSGPTAAATSGSTEVTDGLVALALEQRAGRPGPQGLRGGRRHPRPADRPRRLRRGHPAGTPMGAEPLMAGNSQRRGRIGRRRQEDRDRRDRRQEPPVAGRPRGDPAGRGTGPATRRSGGAGQAAARRGPTGPARRARTRRPPSCCSAATRSSRRCARGSRRPRSTSSPATPAAAAPTSGSPRRCSWPPTAGCRCWRSARPSSTGCRDGALHQGIGLQVPPYDYAHPDDLLDIARDSGRPPLLVALDGVTDPRNLGAVVRSAAAFDAHGVVVPQRRAVGMTASAWRTSAGAAARIRVARAVNLAARAGLLPGRRAADRRPGRRRATSTCTSTTASPTRWRWSWAPRAPGCPGWSGSAATSSSASRSTGTPSRSTSASPPHRPLRGSRGPPPLSRGRPRAARLDLAAHPEGPAGLPPDRGADRTGGGRRSTAGARRSSTCWPRGSPRPGTPWTPTSCGCGAERTSLVPARWCASVSVGPPEARPIAASRPGCASGRHRWPARSWSAAWSRPASSGRGSASAERHPSSWATV